LERNCCISSSTTKNNTTRNSAVIPHESLAKYLTISTTNLNIMRSSAHWEIHAKKTFMCDNCSIHKVHLPHLHHLSKLSILVHPLLDWKITPMEPIPNDLKLILKFSLTTNLDQWWKKGVHAGTEHPFWPKHLGEGVDVATP